MCATLNGIYNNKISEILADYGYKNVFYDDIKCKFNALDTMPKQNWYTLHGSSFGYCLFVNCTKKSTSSHSGFSYLLIFIPADFVVVEK